jgi:hypothetical protein
MFLFHNLVVSLTSVEICLNLFEFKPFTLSNRFELFNEFDKQVLGIFVSPPPKTAAAKLSSFSGSTVMMGKRAGIIQGTAELKDAHIFQIRSRVC